jgi:hypothetical protein
MELTYKLSEDNKTRIIEGLDHSLDNRGKHWIYCKTLKHNLVYKSETFENALLASIASLLYTIKLKNERIADLQKIADLASVFADQIKPDCKEDQDFINSYR